MSALVWSSPLVYTAFDGKPDFLAATSGGLTGDSDLSVNVNWTPAVADPSPYLSYQLNGSVLRLYLSGTAPPGFGIGYGYGAEGDAWEGLLEVAVTVDGIDCSNTLLVAISGTGGNYTALALGYGVAAPSVRWTNIRQAVET